MTRCEPTMSFLQRSKEKGVVRKSPRGLLSVWGPCASFPPAPTAASPRTGRERAATMPMQVRGQSLPLHTVEDAIFRKHVSLLPAISYSLPESTGKTGYYPNVWASIRLQKSSDYIVQDCSEDVKKIAAKRSITSPLLRKIYAKSAPAQDGTFSPLRTYVPRREGTRTGSMSVDREIKRVFHGFDLKNVDVDNIKGLKDRLADQRQTSQNDVDKFKERDLKNEQERQTAVRLAEQEETTEIKRNNIKVAAWLRKHFDYSKPWDEFD